MIFEHTIVANGTSSVHYLPDILESAGTMRYYGLGTILNILLERNAIIPVDELENSLHPDLFAHFINLFLVNSTYSQLIFSTHNLQSLDTEDLRKDVVWFTEKRMMVQQTCFHLMTSISAMAFRFSMHIMQGNLAPNQRWAVFLFLKNDKYGTRKRIKEIRKSYAIIGEGITEFFYFDGFRNVEKDLLKKFNVTLKPDKPKHPDYSDIITKAQSLLAKEFDVVFCLIDMDYINADNVRKQAYDKEKSSCIKAYKNEIYFIESNPAFEFWLLLHFVFTDRQFRNCDEVITELKKNGRLEKYEKNIEYFSKNNLYLQLKEKLESAINHARSISIDINNPHISYSRVFEVFEELLQKR